MINIVDYFSGHRKDVPPEYFGMDLANIFIPTGRLEYGRREGNTSRQVDDAIDLLFQGKKVLCIDHGYTPGAGNAVSTNVRLMEIIKHRLIVEHSLSHNQVVLSNTWIMYLKLDQ